MRSHPPAYVPDVRGQFKEGPFERTPYHPRSMVQQCWMLEEKTTKSCNKAFKHIQHVASDGPTCRVILDELVGCYWTNLLDVRTNCWMILDQLLGDSG